jgi:hypothetical protein
MPHIVSGSGGGGGSGDLVSTNNLSDVSNAATALANLGGASTASLNSAIAGIKWKSSVVAATTANGTLATAFANGQVIDGITLATNNRILLKNQTTGSENGIYTVNASGAPTRATDADAGSELVSATVSIERGTVNADQVYICTTNAITIDSTTITFTLLPSVTGALLAGNNLSDLTNAGTARTSLGLGTLATQSGTFSGTSSGTNTGDQTITLTGAVTGSGVGSFATTFGGVAGGQTIIGGTASGENLTHSSTSHATKGKHIFGTTNGMYFNEADPNAAATTPIFGVGPPTTINTSGLLASFGASYAGFLRYYLYNNNALTNSACALELGHDAAAAGGSGRIWLLSHGYVTSGVLTADALFFENGISGGNVVIGSISAGTDTIIEGPGRVEKLRIGNSPTITAMTVMNTGYVSFTSATTKITQSAGTVFELGATPPSQVAAAGTVLNAYKWDAATATFTTAVNITTAAGLNFIDIEAPTYTNASACVVTNAATMTIKAAPIAAGSLTITNNYALWVQAGVTRLDGGLNMNGSTINGSIATAGNLTLRPNAADAITGEIRLFGAPDTTTAKFYNSNGISNMVQLVIGLADATLTTIGIEDYATFNATYYGMYSQNNNAGALAAVAHSLVNGVAQYLTVLSGTNFSTVGNVGPGAIIFRLVSGIGNMIYRLEQNTGDHIFETTTSKTERARITNLGSMTIGTGLTTSATDGFFYNNSCAGVPTGVPTSLNSGSSVPNIIDRTNNKLNIYSNSLWLALNRDSKGTDIASAGTITPTQTFTYYQITGTTAIDYITNTGFENGNEIEFYFVSALTLNNNTGSVPGTAYALQLVGATNASMGAGSKIRLRRDTALTKWVEVTRSAA